MKNVIKGIDDISLTTNYSLTTHLNFNTHKKPPFVQ